MSDRPSNGEYKYQRDDNADSKVRTSSEKDRDEKEHQVDKAGEYVRELLQEKVELDSQKWPNATRLIDQEIQKTQAIGKPVRDPKYVDIYREKPIRVSVKVLVPVREHPKFNFVGKLLGPKGNSMKRLQEETMCKMAVLGRGSMKDRQKEEECRMSLDPKYAHLSDDLHVEITALAPPAEAYARIAFALAEVRKYLIPDNNDNIRQEQMREMEMSMGDDPSSTDDRRPSVRGVPGGAGGGGGGGGGGILRPSARPTMPRSSRTAILPPPSSRGPVSRPVSAKSKVFSILDRARVAMDQSYGYETATPPPSNRVGSHHDYDYHSSTSSSSRYGDRHYTSASGDDMYPSSRYTTYEYEDDSVPHSSHDYYETSEYPEESSSRAWKSYKTTTTSGSSSRYRNAPYSRPSNLWFSMKSMRGKKREKHPDSFDSSPSTSAILENNVTSERKAREDQEDQWNETSVQKNMEDRVGTRFLGLKYFNLLFLSVQRSSKCLLKSRNGVCKRYDCISRRIDTITGTVLSRHSIDVYFPRR